jgi:hypothetical protein
VLDGVSVEAPISGTAVDGTGGGTDCVLRLHPTSGSFTGSSAQTRAIVNGLGDNGATDPATGGSWNSISGRQWDGALVRWGTPSSYSLFSNGTWTTLLGSSAFVSPTFVPTNNVTPAVTIRGAAGQSRILEWQASDTTVKSYFSLKNFASTYAGLTIQSDAVPNIRLVTTSTAAAEGPAILMGDATVADRWQFFQLADAKSFSFLNRATDLTGSNFGHAIYVDTSNRVGIGAAAGVNGYNAITLTDQFLVNVRNAAYKGMVVKGAASQSGPLIEGQNNGGTPLFSHLADGSLRLPHLADASAANDTIYYSTTSSKLVFKDPSGVVNPLY